MEIALKECYETECWLEILFKVNAIDETTYKNLINKCGTIRRKLIASVTTAKTKTEYRNVTILSRGVFYERIEKNTQGKKIKPA